MIKVSKYLYNILSGLLSLFDFRSMIRNDIISSCMIHSNEDLTSGSNIDISHDPKIPSSIKPISISLSIVLIFRIFLIDSRLISVHKNGNRINSIKIIDFDMKLRVNIEPIVCILNRE